MKENDLKTANVLVVQAQTEVQRLNYLLMDLKKKIENDCNQTILMVSQDNQARLTRLRLDLRTAENNITINNQKIVRQDQLIRDLEQQIEAAKQEKLRIQEENRAISVAIPGMNAEITTLSNQVSNAQNSYTNCVNNGVNGTEYKNA